MSKSSERVIYAVVSSILRILLDTQEPKKENTYIYKEAYYADEKFEIEKYEPRAKKNKYVLIIS